MTLSFVLSHFGLVLLALLVGLLVSTAFRERPWALLVWLPTIAVFAGSALMVAQRLERSGDSTGQKAGLPG